MLIRSIANLSPKPTSTNYIHATGELAEPPRLVVTVTRAGAGFIVITACHRPAPKDVIGVFAILGLVACVKG